MLSNQLLLDRATLAQLNPPDDPWADMAIPDEILNEVDDVWETSLGHEVDLRANVTERSVEGKRTTIIRVNEEFHVFVPRLRSQVHHLKNISVGWKVQSRGSAFEQKAALCVRTSDGGLVLVRFLLVSSILHGPVGVR